MKAVTDKRRQLRLKLIKTVHAAVWAIMSSIVLFVLWSGLTGIITAYSWLAAVIILAEGIILLLFNGLCPLTVLARKYSSSRQANFDIFLPEWLAKYNQLLFGSIFVIGLILMVIRYASQFWL